MSQVFQELIPAHDKSWLDRMCCGTCASTYYNLRNFPGQTKLTLRCTHSLTIHGELSTARAWITQISYNVNCLKSRSSWPSVSQCDSKRSYTRWSLIHQLNIVHRPFSRQLWSKRKRSIFRRRLPERIRNYSGGARLRHWMDSMSYLKEDKIGHWILQNLHPVPACSIQSGQFFRG